MKFIAVRGSGDTTSNFGIIGTKISGALARRAKAANVDYTAYGLVYPAVGIDWWSFTGTGAAIKLVSYNLSKRKGRDNLRAFIRNAVSECPNERLVLAGYSQGAHVVGDVLSKTSGGLTAKELSHIRAVVLIADPRFNSQEKFVQGFSNFRIGRNGILGARSPGDLSSVAGRIRGWCRKGDLVCQGPGTTGNHGQDKYWADYGDDIVNYIVSKLGWAAADQQTPATINLTQVVQGDFRSLRGKWTVRAYTFNPHDGTGIQWVSGSPSTRHTLTIYPRKLVFGSAVPTVVTHEGLTYSVGNGPQYLRLRWKMSKDVLAASLLDESAVINWAVYIYPKIPEAPASDCLVCTNNGVKLSPRPTIVLWSSNNGVTLVFQR